MSGFGQTDPVRKQAGVQQSSGPLPANASQPIRTGCEGDPACLLVLTLQATVRLANSISHPLAIGRCDLTDVENRPFIEQSIATTKITGAVGFYS